MGFNSAFKGLMSIYRYVAQSKASVCGRLLAGIAGSNPSGVRGCLSPVSVVCCQIRADHSSRGVVSNVVYVSVIMNPAL